jgi:hypothetical protein
MCVDVDVDLTGGGLQVGPQMESDSTRSNEPMAQPKIDSSLKYRDERDFDIERVASSLVTDTEIRACGQVDLVSWGGGGGGVVRKKLARIRKCDKARQDNLSKTKTRVWFWRFELWP